MCSSPARLRCRRPRRAVALRWLIAAPQAPQVLLEIVEDLIGAWQLVQHLRPLVYRPVVLGLDGEPLNEALQVGARPQLGVDPPLEVAATGLELGAPQIQLEQALDDAEQAGREFGVDQTAEIHWAGGPDRRRPESPSLSG